MLEIDGVHLEVVVARRRVKNVNARLLGDCLTVSVPLRLEEERLQAMIASLARQLVRRRRAREINGEELASAVAHRVAGAFPSPPMVASVSFVTTQTRRWGSYSRRTGSIRLNAALRLMPAWVLEAVVAHELAHAFHPDHGPAFKALLRRVCPAVERADGLLSGVLWVTRRWSSLPAVGRGLLASVEERNQESDPGRLEPANRSGKGGAE